MIQQIFQIALEKMSLVSITSSQKTVQLKSMPLEALQEDLCNFLDKNKLEMNKVSMTEDELLCTISKNFMMKTVVKLERNRHRPLDVIINIDYNKVGGTKDVMWMSKPTVNQDQYSFRWLWIPLVFGGLIIALINMMGNMIARLLWNNNELTNNQLIGTVVVLSTIIGVGWIYGVPMLIKRRNEMMKEFDEHVMDLITNRINELDKSQTVTPTKRCWSCFEEMDVDQFTCPNCDEEQK